MPGRPYQTPEDRAATQPPTQQPAAQPAQPVTRPQTPAKPINRTMNRYMDPRARQTGDKPTQTPDVYQKPVGYDVRAGYWQEPQRVARYYHAMQTLPPGTPTQPWMDLDKLSQAYGYLQQKNKGSAWYTWDRLEDDDPGNELLAAIPLPPPSAMPEPERKQWYQQWDTGLPQQDDESYYPMPFAEASKTFDAQSLALFPKQGDNVMVPARTMSTMTGLTNNAAQMQAPINPQVATGPHGMPQELYDQLPTWQKVALDVSPWVGKVVGAATLGLAGFGMAGPVGGAAGLAGGWAMGATLEKGVDPETGKPLDTAEGQIAKAMMFLDVAAEQLERGLGFVGQLTDNPLETLANPEAAFQAGALLYESGIIGSVPLAEDEDARRRGVIKYEVYQLGQAEPTILEIPEGPVSEYFMAQARRKIMAGASPEDVLTEMKAQFGFTGQMRDTIGHMFLDPLNMLGDVSNAGLAGLARVGKNAPLEAAALSRSQFGTAVVNFKRGLTGGTLEKAGNMLTNDLSDIPRLYGQALRNMKPEDARTFGAVSRWIAGLDEAGNVRSYVNAEGRPQKGIQKTLDYLRGGTPQARATEVLTHSVDGLQQLINDEPDIARVTAKVQSIAGASPSQVVAALDNDPLPRWFESAEAQPVTLALRDMRKKVDDLWDRWRTTRDQANIVERVSGMMGMDPYELMAKLHNGTPEEADSLYRAFIQRLEKAAAGGEGVPADASAAKILDTLKKDQGLYAMNGAQLRKFADTFLGKDAAPFGDAQYKAYLFHMLSDGVEGWAVKWFGVKPPSFVVRTGTLIKRAQGLVLLGLNPTFLLNNALNNLVTLGWDGLLAMSPARSGRGWLKSMGVSPVRLRAGANAAEIGGKDFTAGGYDMGRQIREASRAGDLVQSMDDFARGGDKFAVFANVSQRIEQWSSELAMTNAMRSWWDQFWAEGRAITKMPDDLAAGLDLVDPGLSRRVRRAIARGKSKAEIEKIIFKDLGRPSLSDVLSPDERALLGHFPGLVDDMESGLAKAETPEDIRAVFTDARARARDAINDQIRSNAVRMTQEAANKVRIEGGQGLLDLFDNQMQQRHDFWLMHFQKMEAASDEAGKYTGRTRAAIWRKATEDADRDWRAYENVEGAKWLGALEGMGIEEGAPEYVEAMNLLFGMRGNWNDYFQRRKGMMDAFFELSEGTKTEARRLELLSMIPGAGDGPTSSQLWQRVNEGLNTEYVNSVLAEDDLQRQLDDVFSTQYAAQFPDNPNAVIEARQWRDAIRDVRRRMVATMVLYRNGGVVSPGMEEWTAMLPAGMVQRVQNLTKLTPPWAINRIERDRIAKEFYTSIYTPYIREMLDASNKNAPAPGRVVNVAEDLAQPMPAAAIETAVPAGAAIPDVAAAPPEIPVAASTAAPDVARRQMQEVEQAGRAGVFKDRALFAGAVDLPAQQALDRKILQYRADQMRANQQAMIPAPKDFTRDAFYREVQAQLGDEQAGAVAEVVDAIAQHWADERGRTVDDWYSQAILQRGGVEGGAGIGQDALEQAQKGVTRWLDNGKAVIHAFEAADVSTMVHEVAHVWLPQMQDADLRTVEGWLRAEYGMELPEGWQVGAREHVQAKERFARAFERYLAEGRAPVPSMRKVFENFKRWMLSIYGKITGSDIDVKLNDDITGLFDTWLGKKGSAIPARPGPDAWPSGAEWVHAHPGKRAEDYYQLIIGAIANGELGFDDGAQLVGVNKAAIGMRDRLTNIPREDLAKMTRQQIIDSVPWEHLDIDPEKYVTDLHRRAIKRVLNDTPDEVLKDYPDLYIQKNPQPQPTSVFDGTGPVRQQGMFTTEDTPLFSGTPMTARAETFTPQETVPQGALFDRAEFVPGIEARQVEGEGATGPLFEAPALRSSRDMTDEEYRQVINLAKDWEHLVYNNGGNARKSDLEDWLIKYHGVERDTGHAIANKLTETFSPRLDEWTRTEVRRPPRLEDYPEIAEYLGVKVEPKVEAPAAPPEVPVSTIEPTPIQLNKTAARYIDQAPAELRSLFKRGITLDAQDIESGGIGGPAWTLYQREADKAWRFLRDSNDPNVTRQTDRMGYSFEGGSVVITAPGRKGGEWKAHYTASTDKVASKIEAPASPEMTDAARAAAPEVVPVRGIDPRDALRTALTDYLKANPGVDLDTVGQAISDVDIPGVGRLTFEQAAEQIGLDDLRTAVNDAWTDARGKLAPVDEPLTIQPEGWKNLIQRLADSDPVTPGEFERLAQRLTGQDMNVPANRQAAEAALEAGYTIRARKIISGDVTKDLLDLATLEDQRRGARLSVARGVPSGDVPLPLARAARVAAGLLPDDSVVELGAAGRLADGIAGATVLDESQARRAIARALDLKAAVNGQGTVTLARVEDAAGAERALASLPAGGRMVAIAPASIGGTAPRIISPDGKYALLVVDKGSGRASEPVITRTWAEFAKAIEDLPARLISPVTRAPNVGQLAQAMPRGETYAYGPSGQRYTFRYRVVPLDELIQSHLDTFDQNPRYPKELQPRNRDRAAYREQVTSIAQNLDERALIETHMVDSGTPVIGGDLIVENGNGRVMGMRRARADYPERWQAYQTRLRERLGIYGLKEDDLSGVKDPVLVRERTSDVDRVAFANEAQASQSMQLAVDELAGTDAKYIDDAALSRLVIGEEQSIEGALNATANRDLVNAFLNAIPAGEKSAFLAPDGSLSNDGLTRLRNAMFVHVYPGEAGKRLADAFLVSQSESINNIRAAIFDTLGIVSQAEALVKQGRRAADLTITDDLARAVDMYARLRADGRSVSDFIKQMPLIPGADDLTPFQMKLLEYIHAHNRSRKKLRELLSMYADNVVSVQQDPGQGALFGDVVAGKGEILDAAARATTGKDAGFAGAAPAEAAVPAATVEIGEGALPQEAPAAPATPAMGAPLGTMAEYTEPPVEEAMLEGWMKDIEPMLSKAEGALLDEGNRKTGLMDLDRDLDPEQKKALRRYLGQVGADMTDAKLSMMRYGESKRDFALLNYSKRTGADNALGTILPYEFWYTRSMLNWAARALSRPAILANWARLRNLQEKYTEGEGTVPTRLKKKVKVKIPYLPDWMGGGMFIDPLKQLFPLEQLTRPWEELATQKNMELREAESVLSQMVEEEEISEAQMQEAMTMQSGPVWEQAVAQARNELDENINNPLDFAFMASGPSLPVSIAWNLMNGNKDKISQLPITRMIQANTAAMGIGGNRGINIEAPLRKATGLPEVDRYEDYRVDRMLANLAADGLISSDDAQRAMIDRAGPAFDMAQKRVSQMGVWQYWGSPLGADMFPEGEKELRDLKTVYDAARAKWAAGDKDALNKFWDAHPEYEARSASFKEPEARLRQYMISEVWDRWNQLPAVHKEQVREQLGPTFTDAFMDKETRAYDTINTTTLASWAQMLGATNPNKAPDAPQINLELAPPEVAAAVERYNQEKEERFPNVGDVLWALSSMDDITRKQVTSTPQMKAYYKWQDSYLANNPNVIPWVTSEKNELYDLPRNVQTAVYSYRTQKEQMFPGIDTVQDQYFAMLDKLEAKYPGIEQLQQSYYDLEAGSKDRKAYLKANPILRDYWDTKETWTNNFMEREPELDNYWAWRKTYSAANPEAAPYILSDQTMARGFIGDAYDETVDLTEFSAELLQALSATVYTGEPLRSGAWMELDAMWEEAGQPYGNLEEWVDKAVKPALRQ